MTNSNDPANSGITKEGYSNGLSKREYIAMMLMTTADKKALEDGKIVMLDPAAVASYAVACTDALIEQLNKS